MIWRRVANPPQQLFPNHNNLGTGRWVIFYGRRGTVDVHLFISAVSGDEAEPAVRVRVRVRVHVHVRAKVRVRDELCQGSPFFSFSFSFFLWVYLTEE